MISGGKNIVNRTFSGTYGINFFISAADDFPFAGSEIEQKHLTAAAADGEAERLIGDSFDFAEAGDVIFIRIHQIDLKPVALTGICDFAGQFPAFMHLQYIEENLSGTGGFNTAAFCLSASRKR